MRIALISQHASPLAAPGEDGRGAVTHVGELSRALAALGNEVRIFTRSHAPDLPGLVEVGDRVTVAHLPAGPATSVPVAAQVGYTREFGQALGSCWRDSDWIPDVTHAHGWVSGLAAVRAGRESGVPVVQTYHALAAARRRGVTDGSPPRRPVYERALGLAVDRVVAQTQAEVGALVRMGISRSRIELIPPGVDLDLFAPDGRAAPRNPERPRLLTVGRLADRKGHGDLIRALRAVPRAECVVIGGPPRPDLPGNAQAQELRSLADSCRVGDRVHLIGQVPTDELPRWYRSADVLVCAPWYESVGRTSLEGMACGLPVLATAVGGLTDTVVDGLTGDLVRPQDPGALGGALRRLLNDPMRRLAYATAAIDRVRQVYPWRRCAVQLQTLYARLARPSIALG